jgi:protein phosphatase
LFVVCDGMGGSAAGEVASMLAVETIGAFVGNGALSTIPTDGFQARTAGLGKAIEEANRAIIKQSQDVAAQAGMGTTVVAVWIGDGLASIAHVGDSRLYVRNASGFAALTNDHSLVEAQVQAGLINRDESSHSVQQNILLRALGRDPDTEVELAEAALNTGDLLLLCTDGLTKTVTDARIAEAIDRFRGDPQGACDHLIAAANDHGGPDNVTVLVVEVEGSRASGT